VRLSVLSCLLGLSLAGFSAVHVRIRRSDYRADRRRLALLADQCLQTSSAAN